MTALKALRDMLNTAFKLFSERGKGKKGPKRLPGIGKNISSSSRLGTKELHPGTALNEAALATEQRTAPHLIHHQTLPNWERQDTGE